MIAEQISEQKAGFPRWLKWAVYSFVVLSLAFVSLYVLLASGLSNATLQSRITSGLSSWSGLRIEAKGGVDLGLFPLKATLSGVKAVSDNKSISLEADAVSVSLPLISLLRQQPAMGDIDISGGRIVVDARARLHLPNLTGAKTVGTSVVPAGVNESRHSSMAETGTAPGILRMRNMILSVQWPGGRLDDLKEFGGTFRWTSLSGSASFSATGVLNGAKARLEGSSAEPLKLLNGSASDVSLQFKSDPLAFDYIGTFAYPDAVIANGQVTMSASSMNEVLSWMNVGVALPGDEGALDLTANLSHADGKLTLNDLMMTFGGNPADGMLVIDSTLPTPLASGTLAFEKADFGSLIAAFQPVSKSVSADSMLTGLDLDLRFSAETVQASLLTLTNAAGTIKISGNETLLDLGSSKLAGGECIGSLKFSGPVGKREGIVKLSLRDVMADQFADYDPSLPVLSAPVSAQIEASGEFHDWMQFIRQANGTLEIEVGEGVARNFSTETFAGLVSAGAVFALTDTYAGLAPVVSGNVSAILSRGAAIISFADLQLTSHKVRLAGAVPLLSGGVALSGHIAPAGDQPDGLPFFLGGTWGRPFVTMGTITP